MYSVKKQNTLFNKGHRWRRYETEKLQLLQTDGRRHITYVWIRGCRNYIKEHELDIEISVFHSFRKFQQG